DIKRGEFLEFEGNAQGFRILTRLEMYKNKGGMRLSKAVLGAFTKYPTTCYIKNIVKNKYCGMKKFGIFESDISIFSIVAKDLGLLEERSESGIWWRRHPLVFLVEAADDICYNILDLEDAFLSGDVEYKIVKDLLKSLVGSYSISENSDYKEIISSLRANGINKAIQACVESFMENYDSIMSGTFSSSLIEKSVLKNEFQKIQDFSIQKIFKSPRKTQLEILGRKVIHNVLDGMLPLYTDVMENGWNPERITPYNKSLARALDLNLNDINNEYDALHSMADFVSGMTDRFALKISKMLSGSL
ncbi:dGTP triphosphohydrolase, partial [Acetobacter orientalis]